ncbi:MAG: hypothetical protein HYX84_05060 [Chloroflexi bacterium]|nr:hypothetical protein [Chloroflexota bacterium]
MTNGLDEKDNLPKTHSNEPTQPEERRITDLESQLARKSEELTGATARIAELEGSLSSRETEIASLKQERAGLELALAGAVANYRALVLQANPGIVEELVSGDTVEAIDASLAKAKALLGKVKQGLAAELSMLRVPVGAPERTLPDVSGLSPREKIQHAMVRETHHK